MAEGSSSEPSLQEETCDIFSRGYSFSVKKSRLLQESPYFEEALTKGPPVIIMSKIPYPVVESFANYVNTRALPSFPSVGTYMMTVKMAAFYSLNSYYVAACAVRLSKHLNFDTVMDFVEYAMRGRNDDFVNDLFNLLRPRMRDLGELIKMEATQAQFMFCLSHLKLSDPAEIFQFVMQWVKNKSSEVHTVWPKILNLLDLKKMNYDWLDKYLSILNTSDRLPRLRRELLDKMMFDQTSLIMYFEDKVEIYNMDNSEMVKESRFLVWSQYTVLKVFKYLGDDYILAFDNQPTTDKKIVVLKRGDVVYGHLCDVSAVEKYLVTVVGEQIFVISLFDEKDPLRNAYKTVICCFNLITQLVEFTKTFFVSFIADMAVCSRSNLYLLYRAQSRLCYEGIVRFTIRTKKADLLNVGPLMNRREWERSTCCLDRLFVFVFDVSSGRAIGHPTGSTETTPARKMAFYKDNPQSPTGWDYGEVEVPWNTVHKIVQFQDDVMIGNRVRYFYQHINFLCDDNVIYHFNPAMLTFKKSFLRSEFPYPVFEDKIQIILQQN